MDTALLNRFASQNLRDGAIIVIMFKSITHLIEQSFRRRSEESKEGVVFDKIDTELTDNMRALRLVATMADQLLSRGMAASDVVHICLGVTLVYCSRRVHMDISHTILSISQDRGLDREPLTIVRTVTNRGSDYQTIQMVEDLGEKIRSGLVSLEDAEHQIDKIITRRRLYPRWMTHASAGGVSAGVVMLYSQDPVVWMTAFIMGVLMNMTLYKLAKSGLPSFYSQAIVGVIVTMIATIVSLLAANELIPFFDSVSSTLLITAGIVLLVAGMMIVSAFQDAIDEFYVTASARLLKVVMMTGGIVVGVTIGLYIATRFGVVLDTTPDRLAMANVSYQYIGAAILSASFALGNQARWQTAIGAGVVGFMSLYIVLSMTGIGFGTIAASGVAAVSVGLGATFLLHFFHIPTLATISSGIIPLVPGMTLYSGLMHIAEAQETSNFDTGVTLLMRAILIAVVVAAGATFGNLIGRPARRRLIHFQNRLPRRRLSVTKKNNHQRS